MSDKQASFTSDQIDDLLLSARYGDLEDLQSGLSSVLTDSSATSSSTLLAEIKNEDGNTLLHYASANGHLEVVEYLLPYLGLEQLLSQNISGNTALHWAGLNGHLDVVKRLVSQIEHFEKKDPELAAKLNLVYHPSNAKKPSSSDAEESQPKDDGSERKLWDVRNKAGRGPMSEAQMREQEQVVKYFLEKMIDGPEGSNLTPAEPQSATSSSQQPSQEPTTSAGSVEEQTANLKIDE